MEFELGLRVIMAMVRQDVQEGADEVERFACNIGDLEDRAYSLGDELSCSLDGLSTVLDKDGDFASTGRLQDTGELRDGLFQDLWRANVDFGDDNHDRNIQSQCNAEVLSIWIISVRFVGDG